MNLKNRQHLLALVAIGVLAYLAAESLVLKPLWKRWEARSARIVQLRKQISQGDLLLQRKEAIHGRWSDMRKNTLPSDTSAAEQRLLQAFDSWARESRISVTSIAPQKRDNDDYTSLECRVDAFGSLSTVTRFLYDIERDPLGLKLESVEISTRDNDGQQIALGLQISGLILHSPAK